METSQRASGLAYFVMFNPIGRWVVFSAAGAGHGYELWKTDGSTAGTELVKDIDPDGSSHPRWFARLDGALLFATNQGLWKTDGTETGTTRVHGVLGAEIPHSGEGQDLLQH